MYQVKRSFRIIWKKSLNCFDISGKYPSSDRAVQSSIGKTPEPHSLLKRSAYSLYEVFGCFTQQKLGVPLHPIQIMWRNKNHGDDFFSFFKIPLFSVFVLALKFPLISPNSAKSCVILLQKGQLFVLENHDACKNKLKSQNISYEKAYEKAEM